MSDLRLGGRLALPLEIVTEATAIVATRGAGKSSASAVVVEEAFAQGVQSVVFDRTGVYWGLRSNKTGEGPGLGIYVLGGPHGDVPLEPAAGKLIADLVVDSGHSFVLDLSDFSKGQAVRFAADFLERIYDGKARARTTTLLVMDEAHFYAPQTPRGGFKGDAARLMGAMEDVVGLGRSRGLGVVLTTQRTQALNKAVLDLIETLFVMRMLSPRARAAVKEWIQEKHEDDEKGVLATLDSLPTGTAWVWSPLRGILEKVAVRRIKTFDSYRAPKPGETLVEPAQRRELDIDALGEQMRTTAERAKADDPAELRKRISQLESELAARPAEVEVVQELVEVMPGFVLPRLVDLQGLIRPLAKQATDVLDAVDALRADVEAEEAQDQPPNPEKLPLGDRDGLGAGHAPSPGLTATIPVSDNGSVAALGSQMLEALGQFHQTGLTKKQLAALVGKKESGGYFRNNLSALRSAGLAEGNDPIAITPAGLEKIGGVPPPLTRGDVLARWKASPKMGALAWEILQHVLGKWPDAVDKDTLADWVNKEASGGYFRNNLSFLSANGLVEVRGGAVRAAESLMMVQP